MLLCSFLLVLKLIAVLKFQIATAVEMSFYCISLVGNPRLDSDHRYTWMAEEVQMIHSYLSSCC